MDILIVEDHKLTQDVLMTLADGMGLLAAGVVNYEEAIKIIIKTPPHVLLTDWDLGEQYTGLDVANYISSMNDRCQIIFFTANQIENLAPYAGHLKNCKFIQKPLSLRELKEIITEALEVGTTG